jgi:hypothetical protein
VSERSKSELYEALDLLNAHRVVLLDVPVLEQQLLGLVWRGGRLIIKTASTTIGATPAAAR